MKHLLLLTTLTLLLLPSCALTDALPTEECGPPTAVTTEIYQGECVTIYGDMYGTSSGPAHSCWQRTGCGHFSSQIGSSQIYHSPDAVVLYGVCACEVDK